ncbi:MAG: hypothetical protein Q7R73_04605, partial [bacterium]|nr:hypothetical protein [bacterium]
TRTPDSAVPLREIVHNFSLPLLTEQIRIRVLQGPSSVAAPLLSILGRIFWSAAILFSLIGARALWKQNVVPRASLLLIYFFLGAYSLAHGLLLTSIDVSQRVNIPTYPFFLTLAVAGIIYSKQILFTKTNA